MGIEDTYQELDNLTYIEHKVHTEILQQVGGLSLKIHSSGNAK